MGMEAAGRRRRTSRGLAAILAAALLAVAAAQGAVAQTPSRAPAAARPAPVRADLSASTANGHGRIVFSFDSHVPAEVKLSGGVLIVSFGQPVEMQAGQLAAQLAGYVSAVRRDPDGRSLRFALAQRLTINTMEAGERLFVDLLPDSWRGPPPGLPAEVVEELTRRAREAERRARLAEAQRAARAMPPVVVRVGNHPTFTRFVFSLPEPVGVALDRAGERLTVRIAKPFTADLRQVREALPPFVSEVEADTTPDELMVRMLVSPHADARAFREETTYVVDLSLREARPAGQPEAGRAGPAATHMPGPTAIAPAPVPVPAQAPVPAAAPREQAPPAAPASAAPAPRSAGPGRAAPAEGGPAEAERPAAARPGRVAIQARKAGDTVRILVPFGVETPGAVFQRADTLWLVFDATEPVDLSGLQAAGMGLFTSVDASRSRQGTAIRLGLDRQSLASASRDGTAWIITLAETVLEPPRPVHLARAADPAARIVAMVDLPQAGTVHRLADPLAGDDLIVVTAAGPARAFLRSQEMVEFVALAGSHGLVFQPLADDLTVSLDGERVTVSRPAGLHLSAAGARPQSAQRAARRPRTIAFDLELWAVDEKAPFRERESDLLGTAAAVHDTQRTARRLDLVRFYMAQERWPEAKAVIDTIMRQDRRVAEDGSIHGLRGVVSLMMHRPQDALADFGNPAIATSPDVALWRAAALAVDGRMGEAHETFEGADASPATLPAPLARAVIAQAVDAALDAGAVERAAQRLAEYQEIGVPAAAEQAFALLRGRLAEAQGHVREALAAYARAANGPDAVVRADADQRHLALRYRAGQIDRQAATEALEVLSYAWRGDEIEARTLALLARLYGEQGRFREAFATMRTALRLHPRSEAVRRMQDEVTRHFEALFLDGGADRMSPVDALALYYDFRDLTPQGRRGDEIIRRLADRLAGLELLDQAAALLQHQVDRRLTGAARSQVAARLALVHLMNRKPAMALQVLRATRLADLPEELRQQRYLLEARALADAGRPDQALDLVGELRTPEAEMLRSDILWSSQRYREAAEQSERWLAARAPAGALGESERQHLLRAAIGYALTDDTLGLDRLRARWRGQMAGTPDARAFDVVTAPIEARGVEYREIARSIADRDTLDAFLKAYRERYPTETPGADQRPTSQAPSPGPRGQG